MDIAGLCKAFAEWVEHLTSTHGEDAEISMAHLAVEVDDETRETWSSDPRQWVQEKFLEELLEHAEYGVPVEEDDDSD